MNLCAHTLDAVQCNSRDEFLRVLNRTVASRTGRDLIITRKQEKVKAQTLRKQLSHGLMAATGARDSDSSIILTGSADAGLADDEFIEGTVNDVLLKRGK